jgi:cell division septation protein DedD
MSPSHYQLSFTARQAMVFFAVCLVALGLSFFFGLMTGLSGRAAESASVPAAAAPAPASADADSAGAPSAGSVPTESPTPPSVLQAFEDRVSEPTALPASSKRPVAAQTASPPASGLWIQVASLASRREADSLAARLSGHGYRAQVGVAESPKGRVFRVRVGPYRSEDEAARAAEKLRRQERIHETWVVRDGR